MSMDFLGVLTCGRLDLSCLSRSDLTKLLSSGKANASGEAGACSGTGTRAEALEDSELWLGEQSW